MGDRLAILVNGLKGNGVNRTAWPKGAVFYPRCQPAISRGRDYRPVGFVGQPVKNDALSGRSRRVKQTAVDGAAVMLPDNQVSLRRATPGGAGMIFRQFFLAVNGEGVARYVATVVQKTAVDMLMQLSIILQKLIK
jgi:hypothetical protein